MVERKPLLWVHLLSMELNILPHNRDKLVQQGSRFRFDDIGVMKKLCIVRLLSVPRRPIPADTVENPVRHDGRILARKVPRRT